MKTFVIRIGSRFFVKFGKGNRALTAWSLAGATTYGGAGAGRDRLHNHLARLEAKGIEPTIREVVLGD